MTNKKNNQKLLMITLLFSLMISLNGCSLAKKDAGNDAKDTLIGAFITDDCLDLFDMDTYLNDNASTIFRNQNTTVNNSGEYISPLYATIDRRNHRDPTYWKISFDGISGLNLLAPVQTEKDGTLCLTIKSSDGICDISSNLHELDNGSETTLAGTIYMTPQAAVKNSAYYVNPVYQSADGKIYAVPGSGISADSFSEEGQVMSTSFSDQTNTAKAGQTRTEKSSVTIRFASMFEPVKITLVQMDKENKVVKQEVFIPGNLPEELTAEKDTAYFLIKTEKKTPDGTTVIARSIYEQKASEEEDPLETFFAADNGIIAKQHTVVTWKK